MTLREIDTDRIALEISDERGNMVEKCAEIPHDRAQSPQTEARHRILGRLGGSIYRIDSLDDRLADRFVPASALTALRRECITLLDSAQCARHSYDRRRPCALSTDALKGVSTSYHDNIANSIAKEFYRSAGATVTELAAEVQRPDGEMRVMTTRYCLRRELGACLRTSSASKLPSPLYLCAKGLRYRLDFDCTACEMHVITAKQQL